MLADLNETSIFSWIFKKILKHQISWKPILWELRSFMQMDAQTWQSQESLFAILWTCLKLGSNRSIKLYLIPLTFKIWFIKICNKNHVVIILSKLQGGCPRYCGLRPSKCKVFISLSPRNAQMCSRVQPVL